MLQALLALGHNQFEWARWAPENYEDYKIIQVGVVSDNEKRWSTTIQNLSTTTNSTVIRTAYVNDYKPGQHIFYRDKWWVIRAVAEKSLDIAPQAVALVKNANRQFVLELEESNGYNA